ncbi:hypothetical protein [Microbacterium sp.]|uniref:hypothetical protein n=1 Tax=Microbacterium sp. TaxID=51671 RepID=UPI002734D3CF|nr:hypothetical protein [Microbacterium sp.]MDP3953195.1 hypothetical protein [Microbacterium sp.]
MTTPYDHDALFFKAKMFLNRAMDSEDVRPFDEQALWASLALELLAKAALARVSPLLVAEPTEDGKNLLIASGLVDGEGRFTSVRAKTLFSRCQKAFRPFNETEAAKITTARNEYLHGSAAGFTNIPESAWWPRYWAQAAILVHALDREMHELVGLERNSVVTTHLEQNTQNLENSVQMLIERSKQRLAQHRAGTLPAKVAREWRPGLDNSAGFLHRESARCPACGVEGLLEGDEVLETDVHGGHAGPGYDTPIELTIGAEYFGCSMCGLALDSYELLEAADLETSFTVEGDPDDLDYYEGDYGND